MLYFVFNCVLVDILEDFAFITHFIIKTRKLNKQVPWINHKNKDFGEIKMRRRWQFTNMVSCSKNLLHMVILHRNLFPEFPWFYTRTSCKWTTEWFLKCSSLTKLPCLHHRMFFFTWTTTTTYTTAWSR